MNESVSAAVLDADEIVYVARIPTTRIMAISLGLGSRLPAHCTSMGRVLLAGLAPEQFDRYLTRVELTPRTAHTITDRTEFAIAIAAIRKQGWALLDQELEEGVRSVAAPLRDRRGRVVAALNVGTQTSRVSLTQLRTTVLPKLTAAADQINALLAKR